MNKTNVLGIDPGLTGAMALLDSNGNFITVEDMPTHFTGKKNHIDPLGVANVIKQFSHWNNSDLVVTLEKVGPMPGQGVVSMFNFGFGFGVLQGCLAMGDIPFDLVSAQSWKREAGLIGLSKDSSRQLAQRLYSTAPLELKKHHGRAESILIARFGGRYGS